MGKASRNKRESAREKIAAQRAAERRREVRNRLYLSGGSILGVVVIVVAFLFFKTLNHGSPAAADTSAPTGSALPASVMTNVRTVPDSALNAVGAGSVNSYTRGAPVKAITGAAALTSAGKPEMLYIGAQFCPLCAAMRWSMAVALSRFGTLSNVTGSHSSSTDTDPNTPTLDFYKSGYSSKYLTFTSVENETVSKALLQTPTKSEQALWNKYEPNSFPFIDVGNKYQFGITYDPAVLAGKTWSQVAAALHDPSSAIAQGALGTANYLTAALCKVTSNTPASACSIPAVKTLEGKL
jgi:Domain of unknown function (DUF929)